jgi:hypothetical protein
MNIDPKKVSPVPKADIDKLRMAVRERVIKPILARSLKQRLLEADARRRPLKALIRIQHKALRLPVSAGGGQ